MTSSCKPPLKYSIYIHRKQCKWIIQPAVQWQQAIRIVSIPAPSQNKDGLSWHGYYSRTGKTTSLCWDEPLGLHANSCACMHYWNMNVLWPCVARRHQAVNWTNVDLSSNVSCDIHKFTRSAPGIDFIEGWYHYNDVIMDSISPQITSLTIIYSAV